MAGCQIIEDKLSNKESMGCVFLGNQLLLGKKFRNKDDLSKIHILLTVFPFNLLFQSADIQIYPTEASYLHNQSLQNNI